uniref:Uncharacterized protein n=1 Tax=Anopheles atroparvus TaxID=41427 RepID=A0A182ITB3_ANOAO
MELTAPVWSLLAIVACQSVSAMFNSCTNGDACIDIRQCDRFGPHHNEPSRWSTSLKHDFRSRVCQRESLSGVNTYKVCCPSPAVATPATVKKRRLELLDLEHCGDYSEDRIAFGNNAKLFQYPWMALLRSGGEWICGGTLINERYVLTAAHCVKNKAFDYVRLGEFELNRTIDCDLRNEACAAAPQNIPVEREIMHLDYSPRRKQNDIALLRLAYAASINDNVKPICLPVSPVMRTIMPTYYVAGWGATENSLISNKLQFTELNLTAKDECQSRISEEDKHVRIVDTQMCATGVKHLSENCIGDSGGPMKSVSVSARYVQYGVVSFGLKSCGKKAAPGVYTRVESFIDWILDSLEE